MFIAGMTTRIITQGPVKIQEYHVFDVNYLVPWPSILYPIGHFALAQWYWNWPLLSNSTPRNPFKLSSTLSFNILLLINSIISSMYDPSLENNRQ